MASEKGKNVGIVVGLVVVVALVFAIYTNASKKEDDSQISTGVESSEMSPSHPLNATYSIEGSEITLVDGMNEEQIADSSSTIITSVWGEPINKSREGETQDFWAVTLNQIPGGSGSFYYISSCVGGGSSCTGTNAILLGDRIAMQTVEIEADGTIIVNYADRPADAPMTEQPSVGVTRRFTVIDNALKEVLGS